MEVITHGRKEKENSKKKQEKIIMGKKKGKKSKVKEEVKEPEKVEKKEEVKE